MCPPIARCGSPCSRPATAPTSRRSRRPQRATALAAASWRCSATIPVRLVLDRAQTSRHRGADAADRALPHPARGRAARGSTRCASAAWTSCCSRASCAGCTRRCSTRSRAGCSTFIPRCCRRLPGSTPSGRRGAHGVRVTGCTVHLVEDALDAGPIVAQTRGRGARRRHARDARGARARGRARALSRGPCGGSSPSRGACKVAASSSEAARASCCRNRRPRMDEQAFLPGASPTRPRSRQWCSMPAARWCASTSSGSPACSPSSASAPPPPRCAAPRCKGRRRYDRSPAVRRARRPPAASAARQRRPDAGVLRRHAGGRGLPPPGIWKKRSSACTRGRRRRRSCGRGPWRARARRSTRCAACACAPAASATPTAAPSCTWSECGVREGLEFVVDSQLVGVEKPDPRHLSSGAR